MTEEERITMPAATRFIMGSAILGLAFTAAGFVYVIFRVAMAIKQAFP